MTTGELIAFAIGVATPVLAVRVLDALRSHEPERPAKPKPSGTGFGGGTMPIPRPPPLQRVRRCDACIHPEPCGVRAQGACSAARSRP